MGRLDPADPDEFEDFEGGYKGCWVTAHDEADGIFAWCGPVELPAPYKE